MSNVLPFPALWQPARETQSPEYIVTLNTPPIRLSRKDDREVFEAWVRTLEPWLRSRARDLYLANQPEEGSFRGAGGRH